MSTERTRYLRSHLLVGKALAHARREAYYTAAGMTQYDLRNCEPSYRAAMPGPVTGEALTQLRMVRTILAQRTRSTRSRSRAAAQFRAARARTGR